MSKGWFGVGCKETRGLGVDCVMRDGLGIDWEKSELLRVDLVKAGIGVGRLDSRE